MRGVVEVSRVSLSDIALYLLGVAGLAASVSALWLSMRAVMNIGGFCAEGGPYVIEHHCPEGAVLLMTLAFPGLFLFTGLIAWRGARIGRPFGELAILMWPATFLSLGWNFLEFGIPSANQPEVIWGWLVPGVVFVLMGLAPLYVFWPSVGLTGKADPERVARLREALDRAQRTPPGASSSSAGSPRPTSLAEPARTDLVSQLERLARLYESGSLTKAEYDSAKQRMINEPGGSS